MRNEKKSNLICSVCEKGFYRKPSQINPEQKEVYCSRKCWGSVSKKPLEIYQCSFCNKTIELKYTQSRNSKTGRHYCDNNCKNKHIATFGRGIHNTNSPISYQCRIEFLKIANNYNCQQCNNCEDSRLLDVHHIDEHHKNNNWDNLIVLCVLCHAKHHRGVSEITVKSVFINNELTESKYEEYNLCKKKKIYKDGANKGLITKSEKYGYKESDHITKNCEYCKEEFVTNDHKQIYCTPSCASFGSRKTERPSKEELKKLISENSWEAIGRIYNVNGNTIKYWARGYGIEFQTRGCNRNKIDAR